MREQPNQVRSSDGPMRRASRSGWLLLPAVVLLAVLVGLPASLVADHTVQARTGAAASSASVAVVSPPVALPGPADPPPNPGDVFDTVVLANGTVQPGNFLSTNPTNPEYPVYDPENGLLFFAAHNETGFSVDAWDPATQSVVGSTIMPSGSGGYVAGLVLDAADGELFVITPLLGHLVVMSDTAPFDLIGTAPTGYDPYSAAIDPASDELFVPNYYDFDLANDWSNVTVLDAADPSVVLGSFDSGNISDGALFDPAYGTGAILVANYASNNLTVYDVEESRVVGSVAVGSGPEELAYDPVNDLVYVANYYAGTISVLDASTLAAVTPPIKVDYGTSGLNVSAAGDLYVSNVNTGNISVISGADPTAGIVENISEGSTVGAANNPSDDQEFVADPLANSITVIGDVESPPSVVANDQVGTSPGPVAYSATHDEYFVGGDDSVEVVNATTRATTGFLPLSFSPYSLLTVDAQNQLWISGLGSLERGWLDVANETTLEVSHSLDTGGFGLLAYDSTNNAPGGTGTIFLANTNGTVDGIDPADDVAFEAIPVGFLSEFYNQIVAGGMVWDSQTDDLYLTDGSYASMVTVLGADPLQLLTPLPTGGDPTGIVLDSASGMIYVANARNGNLTKIDPLADSSSGFGTPFAYEPTNLTYDVSNGYLYVVDGFVPDSILGNVSVVQASSYVFVENLTIGARPEGIAYASNEGNVSVANFLQGTLSLIGEYTPIPPKLSVAPGQGPEGATVTVAGVGYTYPQTLTLDFDGVTVTGSSCEASSSLTVNPSGGFACTLQVPSGTTSSTVSATDTVFGLTTTTFRVTALSLLVAPRQGPVGSPVTITGSGFSVSSALSSLTFDGVDVLSCSSGGLSTTPTGAFSCSTSVPEGTSGSTVVAIDAGGAQVSKGFTVTNLDLGVNPAQGPVGATVTITGTGFTVDQAIESLTFGGDPITTCLAGELRTGVITPGGFKCTVPVPQGLGAGRVTITAEDATGGSVSTAFSVTQPKLQIRPGQGPIGATLTATGQGFSVDEPIANLAVAGVTISACVAGSLTTGTVGPGAFSCTFVLPAGASAAYPDSFATDVGGASSVAPFKVTSLALGVRPSQGPVGATVTITGTGFSVDSPVSLVFDSQPITSSECLAGTSLTTGGPSPGGFKCQIDVPSGTSGTQVVATDVGGQAKSTLFTVTVPSLSVTPGSGPVGSSVTVVGRGFSVDTPLGSLDFDGVLITTCTSGSLTTGTTGPGAFTCTFLVPAGTSSTHVVATDVGGASITGAFVVDPPPASLPQEATLSEPHGSQVVSGPRRSAT